ncbi:heparinase [Fulvitalea axinellae]|uniref:Heparinase n=1 Tax=Fulvitalea axinellae TaxID=1182444 RepID=A0AAU9D9M0_9BACT|nr:heparinase [Fulvitalea axinellae]
MRYFVSNFLLLILLFRLPLSVEAGHKVFTTKYTLEDVRKAVAIQKTDWLPFPRINDRKGWNALPDNVRKDLVKRGEKAMQTKPRNPLPSEFMESFKKGDRSKLDKLLHRNLATMNDLVLAECVENKGRFIPFISDFIWTFSEASTWSGVAHLTMQRGGRGLPLIDDPVVDLFAGRIAKSFAITDYLLGDKLDGYSKEVRRRMRLEVKKRVLDPVATRDTYWWMGKGERFVNNWNPWVSSNVLIATLVFENDPKLKAERVYRLMGFVDRFFNQYPEDGGCDEGPNYWGRAAGSAFDFSEWIRIFSQGKMDVNDDPLFGNMLAYIYKSQISGKAFVNYADAAPFFTPPVNLIARAGEASGDKNLTDFATYFAKGRISKSSIDRQLFGLFFPVKKDSENSHPPYLKDVWLKETGFMTARDKAGSDKGFFLSAKAGHNAESHNHNDVGNFVLYFNGKPVLVDVGSDTYTLNTFGPNRYKIWNMQSEYHNLPVINGIGQKNGREFKSSKIIYSANSQNALLSQDIASAYPKNAGVKSWNRTIKLKRGKGLELTDRFVLNKTEGKSALHFMTPNEVRKGKKGKLIIVTENGDEMTLTYNASVFEAEVESVSISKKIKRNWGQMNRIVLTAKNTPKEGKWKVFVRN